MHPLIINGKAIRPGQGFHVLNPANVAVAGTAPNATEADLDAAIAAAQTAYRTLSRQPEEARRKLCKAMADALDRHQDAIRHRAARDYVGVDGAMAAVRHSRP